MAGFQGFGYKAPEEIIAETQAGFQRALQSGNPNQMRAAIAQQAAFALGGNPELRRARKTENILQEAYEKRGDSGDPILDNLNFYRAAAKAAADAGLPDIALQATEKLTALTLTNEERNRLKTEETRKDYRFAQEQEEDEVEATERRLERRTKVNAIGVNAYRDTIQGGGDEVTAKQNARKAQLAYLSAQTEGGSFSEGTKLAAEQGFDLDTTTFDVDEAEALTQDSANQLKSLTTVMGEDGVPKLAYVVQGPNGPQIIPTGFDDANAQIDMLKASKAGSSNVTDAERKNAAFALNMTEAQKVIAELDWNDNDFTTVGSTIDRALPNRVTSDELQKYEQAKEIYINAKLRRESGATIKDEEYYRAEAAMFPEPGDSRAEVEQKRRMRQAELAGIQAAAGPVALADAIRRYEAVQIEDQRARELYELGL